MDRRQRKTREAIFKAFIELLSERPYHRITVGDILERADVGRATFYAHFETKDFLLKELCEDLFDHIADTAMSVNSTPPCAYGTSQDSVFLHLLRHLQQTERSILQLLSSENNEIFLQYFKTNLKKLILPLYPHSAVPTLPEEYWTNHIAASFVEAVRFWISHRCKESPETIANYFAATVDPLMKQAIINAKQIKINGKH